MIYLDNSATTMQKPPGVAEAMAQALARAGNPGRGAYDAARAAAHGIFAVRRQVAALTGCQPMQVAFTSGATESLFLLLNGLVVPGDHVITTVLEHNSVLRPLYHSGCALSFIGCDDEGRLLLSELPGLLRPETKLVVCTHASNLVGSRTDVATVAAFCRQHGLVFVLDAAQTMGSIPVTADMADYVCFTGHKALLGPQGTGGVISRVEAFDRPFITGGTGDDSFLPHQLLAMPDVFEAGTPNTPGICGLSAGVAFVNETGLIAIAQKETALCAHFLGGLRKIAGVTLYGPKHTDERLAVVALNVGDLPAEDVALRLWERHGIATRAGSHCAPLAHQRFGTKQRGMVRFSFGYMNQPDEVDAALAALQEIARDI